MDQAPGLFDRSVNTTPSRRRRLNFVPQPEDRLPTTTTTPQPNDRTTASARARRSAPMVFDPEIATPNWEIYRDPSAESLEVVATQPDTTEPTTSAAILAPTSASPQAAPNGQQATHDHDADTSSTSSDPSTRPQHQIGQAGDEASRHTLDRMLRTVNAIFGEERRRQRRFLRRQRRQAQDGNGTDAHAQYVRPTDAEMVARMQARYAELTLLDEGDGNQRSVQELEVEHGSERQPELEQNVNPGQVEESSQEQAYGHDHDHRREDVAGQPQGQDFGIVPEEMTGREEVPIPHQDYHDVPVDTQQVIQPPVQRTSGPHVRAPTTAELISDSPPTPGSAYVPRAAPTPRTGLSFAERARARGMNFDMDADIAMDTDVELYPQARKRARRIAPDPVDDDEGMDVNMQNLGLGTVGQAEMPPEDDLNTRVALLSERMQATRDIATATAATLGDTLAAANALAADIPADVSMQEPMIPDPHQAVDAEPTADESPPAVDKEARKPKQEERKQGRRKIKKPVNREARGLQRI
ncbi:hypothetical protein EPUS_03745 [Endocarpon pusillum Z07020]|uniref:Uncharacterized protein n=1 Tax=Endocarpon pusillum (strain Z07020 / HMAS-L-300199) TaxID=1263415 RepID=U1FUF2_ENDPU|nr:uncharacterized protein EPUS_03745 [Endocarpon pusillum Z07020]ERF68427.1 hypothetical protein EPUS_03745 [Endocarpon pusillum Z07020]